ncbi:MAG: hypothetical protein ACFB2W_12075 [Leptolyngbyaceae cyanobacterium]
MLLSHQPALPTPWDSDLDQSIIAASAYVHPQCSLIGDVQLGENVTFSPIPPFVRMKGLPFTLVRIPIFKMGWSSIG